LVDQKESLGFVGDVFEMMAQVDRHLTKVNPVDWIIRVINPAENLGRHKYERQTVPHLQQEIVTLQDKRIQWHQERAELTEQLFTRDHALEMTQVQLAHTEAQRFALVQNVVEMQNEVAEMEIEVEVWQAMAQQGQQPPIAPPAAPAAPDEL
jgi:predicted P-loop ATPase/GTPase